MQSTQNPIKSKGSNIINSIFNHLDLFTIFIISLVLIRLFLIDYTLIPSESMSNTVRTGDFVIFRKIDAQSFLSGIPILGRYFYNPNVYNKAKSQRILKKIRRGDLILWTDGKHNYMKRVLALPGDVIEYNPFDIKVNGVSTMFNDDKKLLSDIIPTTMLHDNGIVDNDIVKIKGQVVSDETDDISTTFDAYYSNVYKGYHKADHAPVQNYIPIRMNASYRSMIVPEGYVIIRGDNRDHSYDSICDGLFVRLDSIVGTALYQLLGTKARYGFHNPNQSFIDIIKGIPYAVVMYILKISPRISSLMPKRVHNRKHTHSNIQHNNKKHVSKSDSILSDKTIKLDALKAKIFELTGLQTRSTLLSDAITHPSASEKTEFEKLEFIGDKVIALYVANLLYDECDNEKQYSQMLVSMTNRDALLQAAKSIDLEKYIVWKGEHHHKDTILVDSFEAIIGAIFLAQELDIMNKLLAQSLPKTNLIVDPKNVIQEWSHKNGYDFKYELVSQEGQEHNKVYTMKLIVNNKEYIGTGLSIKLASKAAANKCIQEEKLANN